MWAVELEMLPQSTVLDDCGNMIAGHGEPFRPQDGNVLRPSISRLLEHREHVCRLEEDATSERRLGFGGSLQRLDRWVEITIHNSQIRLDAYSSDDGHDIALSQTDVVQIAQMLATILFERMRRTVVLHASDAIAV